MDFDIAGMYRPFYLGHLDNRKQTRNDAGEIDSAGRRWPRNSAIRMEAMAE